MRNIWRIIAARRWLQVLLIATLFVAGAACLVEIAHVSSVVRAAWDGDGENATVRSAHERGTVCFGGFVFFDVLAAMAVLAFLRIGADAGALMRWMMRVLVTAAIVPVAMVVSGMMLVVYAVMGRSLNGIFG